MRVVKPRKYWVDIQSGTWGPADDLKFIELDDNAAESFAELSDTDRIQIAITWND